jgi:energy-coupling factor transport system permease protein
MLVMAMALTTLAMLLNNPAELGILVSIMLILLVSLPGSNRAKRLLRRLRGMLPLLAGLFIAQVVFRRDGVVLWEWGFLKITTLGISAGVSSMERWLVVLFTAGLLFDYPFSAWLNALRAWRAPADFAFLVAVTMQFIPMLEARFKESREALFLRGIDLSRLPWGQRLTAYRTLVFPILGKTLWQTRYMAISLELRGFRRHSVPVRVKRLGVGDFIAQVITITVAAGIILSRSLF